MSDYWLGIITGLGFGFFLGVKFVNLLRRDTE